MIIEEKFYTLSESELFSLCRYFMARRESEFIIDTYERINQLISQGRISQLKFKVSIDNDND